MIYWGYLAIAIFTEIIATAALRASESFTVLIPSIIVVLGYALSFYFMSLTLKAIPVSITYPVWSGVGIVCISAIGYYYFKEPLDWIAMLGIGLIVLGTIILFGFSGTTPKH